MTPGEKLDRLFDKVFVRPPGRRYYDCVSANPDKRTIDVGLARTQHRGVVSLLRSFGVTVVELKPLDDLPDSVFMQDPGILGNSRSVIGRFGEKSRRRENGIFASELKGAREKGTGKLSFVREPGTLEGGDIMTTPSAMFVGQSRRSNLSGIRQLAGRVRTRVVPVKVNLNHLSNGCTYLSGNTILIAPHLVDPDSFAGFKFVKVPREEAYASNALYIGEGRVAMPSGFPRTRAKLVEAGYKPEETDMTEFEKGDGAMTCLSSPVFRDVF